jgi:CMP/dCMP kinase
VKKVIAIDGPSGAGKSTIAKLIAKELGYAYLDTGALYRAVALNLIRLGINELSPDNDLIPVLNETKVEFKRETVLLNGQDVSHEIRSPEAGHYASVFSAKMPVRKHLMHIQRDAAMHSDLVAEGRDMTTVVFPDAFRKFYLDASVEERAERRTRELLSRGFEVNGERIRLDIMERDARDAGRDIAPLKKTGDAYCIDSTSLSIDDVFQKILAIIRKDNNDQ